MEKQNSGSIQKGKKEIILLFGAGLLVSVAIIGTYNLRIGQDKAVPQVLRTIFALVIMYFTYQGSTVAKWILTGLYLFSATSLVYNNFLLDFFLFNPLLYLFLFYLFFAFYLQFSKHINVFLSFQKNKEA